MHSRPYPSPSRSASRQTQSGVVLIVVLIMLVVIGLVSATAMRGALTADQISNNARLESLAKQAAQIALRYCETEAAKDASARAITIQAAAAPKTKQAWETYGNWVGTKPLATTISKDYMKSTDSAFTPSSLPQCMAEISPDSPALTIVTARGFGPDYVATSNAGAVVWLQSIIAKSSI